MQQPRILNLNSQPHPVHPRVSVIVPVYNAERFLARCLDSLVGQSLRDLEIIAVNDGSTDGSLGILRDYAASDSRIIVMDLENGGSGRARNAALDIARGGCLCCVDSDDYRDTRSLERLYEAIREFDADIAYGDRYYMSESGTVLRNVVHRRLYNQKFPACEMLTEPVMHWQMMYRREAVAGLRFLEDTYWDDIVYVLEAYLKAATIVHVPDAYYYYREYGGNQTHTVSRASLTAWRTARALADLAWRYRDHPQYYRLIRHVSYYMPGILAKTYGPSLPPDVTARELCVLYRRFFSCMRAGEKLRYGLFTLFRILVPRLIFENRRRTYCSYYIFLRVFKLRRLTRRGAELKLRLRNLRR